MDKRIRMTTSLAELTLKSGQIILEAGLCKADEIVPSEQVKSPIGRVSKAS